MILMVCRSVILEYDEGDVCKSLRIPLPCYVGISQASLH